MVIYFERAGQRVYVRETSVRDFDNKLVPLYTEDINDAYRYEDDKDALEKISQFHNPHNRIFKTAPFESKESKKDPFKRLKEKDALI